MNFWLVRIIEKVFVGNKEDMNVVDELLVMNEVCPSSCYNGSHSSSL